MSENNQKIVLFDFDGVIADTYALSYGIRIKIDPTLTEDVFKSYFEGDFYSPILKDEYEVNGKKVRFFDEYTKEIRKQDIHDIVKEHIKALSHKYRLTIVSSSNSQVIKDYLDQQGLLEYFSDILGNDVHKSKTEKIKMLLEKYKTNPDQCVFVTDTIGDIKEARKCGVPTLAVTWGFHSKELLEKEMPDAIIFDPSELNKAINSFLEV